MKLAVGIIGLGVGEAHIKGYESYRGCEVVALCDRLKEKRAAAKKKYPGMRITENANDILDDPAIDVVSIASYDNDHYAQVMRALAHNKHVFVEKPLCLREKEARAIRKLHRSKGRLKISSNLILRKSPRFGRLKEMIQNGTMGELFHIEGDYNYGRFEKITEGWRGKMGFYSVVYGGGVHIVDLMLWLTGGTVEEVSAYANRIASRKTPFRYNDMVTCILKFKSGMTGKMSVNFACVFPHFHNLSVYGTKATFVNGKECGLLFTSRDSSAKPKKITDPYPGIHKGDLIYSFVNSIMNGAKSEVSGKDIFQAMSVCFAIEKATHTQGPVKVRYL